MPCLVRILEVVHIPPNDVVYIHPNDVVHIYPIDVVNIPACALDLFG